MVLTLFGYKDGIPRPLLPVVATHHTGRKCLVLDLDETLVHSSFKVRRPRTPRFGPPGSLLTPPQLIPQADYVVPVEIEWQWHNVYVIKRPGVDNFLKQMGELYEIVVFTASLSKVSYVIHGPFAPVDSLRPLVCRPRTRQT